MAPAFCVIKEAAVYVFLNMSKSSAIESIAFCFALQLRNFQTSVAKRDIDQAARYIGAGAATVGVAGSGVYYYSVLQLVCIALLLNNYTTTQSAD